MKQVVGVLPLSLSRKHGLGSSPLGTAMAEAMRRVAKAEVGVQNKGGVRANLPKGKVTYRQVFQAAPFDNTVVIVYLRGEDLWKLCEQALKSRYSLDFAGLQCVYTLSEKGPVLEQVFVQGKPIDRRKIYKVATNSFLAKGGDGYRIFCKGKQKDTGILYREALLKLIKSEKKWQWVKKEHFIRK